MRRTSRRSATSKNPPDRQPKPHEDDNEIPEVYREMLAEAEVRGHQSKESDRPIKRRKVGERTATFVDIESANQGTQISEDQGNDSRQPQTAYDSEASDDELDIEWEDIDLQQTPLDSTELPSSRAGDQSLEITFGLGNKQKKTITPRQKPLSAAEKKLRLDTHKTHLLCLLRHVHLRNRWCNDPGLQDLLKSILPQDIISLLNPSEKQDKMARSRIFMNGLNLAGEAFGKRFRVTTSGMKRAHWAHDPQSLRKESESIMSNTEVFLSIDDFRKQAKRMTGSRDFGAQLFCALLRYAAVDARLVCSLQPLPFSGTTKDVGGGKPKSYYATVSADDHDASHHEAPEPSSTSNASRPRNRRLAQPQFAPRPATSTARNPPAKRPESSFPVSWVEAFNEGAQKWIAVDPLVTKSLAKPHNLEPPASDHLNIMSYVVAFNEDTTARDVTRRYTRAFNAKTRKIRVESTKGGEKWWEKTMEIYENPFVFDRDAMEFNELTSNTASEPMPRNVQDFKDHPFYALERHLRRNETIFPKRVIGHLAVGKSGSQNQGQKPVYRRSDVHVVRSADGWYRLGRDVKPGEQALKHVPANRNKLSGDIRDEEDDLTMETPLYAEYQTDVYRAPPIVNGKVPKNVYGNLDIYTPTMVPPGGIHIKRPDAAQAAKILAIDYAPAVTGFDFKGRHGTAVIHGIVVASEHRAAVELVISGLANERREAELEERSEQALRLWEQFMLKLRIAERVKGYAVEGDEPSAGVDESYEEPHDNAGGFLPESDYEGNDPFSTHNALSGNNSMRGSFFDTARQDPFAGGFIPDEGTGAALLGPISSGQDHAPSSTSGHAGHTSQYRLVVALENKSSDDSGVPEAFHLCSGPGNSVGLHSELGSAIPGAETSKEPEIPLEGDFERKSPSPDPSHTAPQEDTQMNSPNPSPKASDSDYQGSMLSEDPEDVDSFPEWLL